MPSSEIKLHRKQPQEWDQLLHYAHQDMTADNEAVPLTYGLVNSLSMYDRDSNRYYAYGLALCEFARELMPIVNDEERRQKLVLAGARAMSTRVPDEPNEVRLRDGELPLRSIFHDAAIRIDNDVRVVGDVLQNYRQYEESQPVQLEPIQFGAQSPLINRIESDLFAGIAVIRAAVRYRNHLADDPSIEVTTDDIAFLRKQTLWRYMRGFAAHTPIDYMRQGGFERRFKIVNDATSEEVDRFDWRSEREALAQITPLAGKRSEPCVCPAANIPSLFDALGTLALDMLETVARDNGGTLYLVRNNS